MPADVAMQDPRAVVSADPLGDQYIRIVDRAVLEHRVQQRMRGVGVLAAQLEAAFGHRAALCDLAVLRQRPAEIGEKPPVLAVMRRVALAQILPRLVVIGHAGKREQAEGAERQRQHHGVARPALQMLQRR